MTTAHFIEIWAIAFFETSAMLPTSPSQAGASWVGERLLLITTTTVGRTFLWRPAIFILRLMLTGRISVSLSENSCFGTSVMENSRNARNHWGRGWFRFGLVEERPSQTLTMM